MKNHYNVNHITAKVRDSFLYQNEKLEGYTGCKIFSICTYLNETLTFDIILDNGSIFNYVPMNVIFKDIPSEKFELTELVYHNCLSLDISINCMHILTNMHGYAYIKSKKEFRKILNYICTIDFYTGNEILHLCVLDNNNFVLLPNHKILFYDCEQDISLLKFRQYKKVRGIFKV